MAAAELKQLGLKFKWYFIGEGGERSCIEQMKQEYGVMKEVVLLGFQKIHMHLCVKRMSMYNLQGLKVLV